MVLGKNPNPNWNSRYEIISVIHDFAGEQVQYSYCILMGCALTNQDGGQPCAIILPLSEINRSNPRNIFRCSSMDLYPAT